MMASILTIFLRIICPKCHPLSSRLREEIFKDTQFDI